MNLESPKVVINKSSKYLFKSLSEIENYKKLMPENIAKFEVLSEDTFVFCLTGMPEIKLKITEKSPSDKIILGAAEGKLPFTLIVNLTAISENSSEAKLNFSGDFNPMMAMMVKGPISKFIETLAKNMNSL